MSWQGVTIRYGHSIHPSGCLAGCRMHARMDFSKPTKKTCVDGQVELERMGRGKPETKIIEKIIIIIYQLGRDDKERQK